jgi:hypothetical protein
MPANTTALVFEIDALAAKKKERIRVTISSPYAKATGEWACLFELRGSKEEDEKHEYYGADGLQAFLLNLFYLRSVFRRLRKKGYSFHEIEGGAKIDPEMYFDVFSKPA